jgi:hypothetical protein
MRFAKPLADILTLETRTGRKILHQIDNQGSFAGQQKISAPKLGNAGAQNAKRDCPCPPVT